MTDLHLDLTIIGQQQRAETQAPRRYRRQQERVDARMGDGTTGGKGVGRGACWRGEDESVCLDGRQLNSLRVAVGSGKLTTASVRC